MGLIIVTLIAGALPIIPGVYFAIKQRHTHGQITQKFVVSIASVNLVIALMVIGLSLFWLFNPGAVSAAGLRQEASADPYAPIAAAVAVSVGSISAAYAVSTTGSAAVGAIAEKPDIFGRALIFVGLAEGVAIYGLIIAFIILNR